MAFIGSGRSGAVSDGLAEHQARAPANGGGPRGLAGPLDGPSGTTPPVDLMTTGAGDSLDGVLTPATPSSEAPGEAGPADHGQDRRDIAPELAPDVATRGGDPSPSARPTARDGGPHQAWQASASGHILHTEASANPVLGMAPVVGTPFSTSSAIRTVLDTADTDAPLLQALATTTETFTGGLGAFAGTMNYFQNAISSNNIADGTETLRLGTSQPFFVESFQAKVYLTGGGNVTRMRVEGISATGDVVYTGDFGLTTSYQTISIGAKVASLRFIPITVAPSGTFVGQGSLPLELDNIVYDPNPPGNTAPTITGLSSTTVRAFNEGGGVYPFSDPVGGGIDGTILDSDGDQVTVRVRMDDPTRGLLVNGLTVNGQFFVTQSDGSMLFTGSAADATTLLRNLNLIFSNVDDVVDTGQVWETTFTVTATDGINPIVTNTDARARITGVNEAPTVTSTGGSLTSQFTYDRDFIQPFGAIVFDDPDNKAVTVNDVPPDTLRVDVRFNDADGSLVGAGWTRTGLAAGVATWSFTGNYLQSTAAIQSVLFNPTDRFNPGQDVVTSFSITVTDAGGLSAVFGSAISVLARTNTAPVISGPDLVPTVIDENADAPAAIAVSSLVSGSNPMVDPDTNQRTGIAITSAAGDWRYTTNGTDFFAVGPVSAASALVLSSTSQLRYFGSDANGSFSLTYRAWDRSSWDGAVGGAATDNATRVLMNTTQFTAAPTNVAPFSQETVDVIQTVIAINDAPVRLNAAETLAAVAEDTAAPAGASVASLFAAGFDDSADNQTASGGSSADGFAGVLVVANTTSAAEGTWQFFTGGAWQDIGAISATSQLLLAATDLIRFVPAANYFGTPGGLEVRLADTSQGPVTGGTRIDPATRGGVGGTTAFSQGTVTLGTSITAVNDAPEIVAGGATAAFTENGVVAVDPALAVTDIDSATLASATVQITGGREASDVLALVPDSAAMGNISASYDSGTGTLTLTSAGASATLAQFQAALRAVTFSSTSENPSTVGRTITFTVNDGGLPGTVAQTTLAVTAVNDDPTATGIPAAVTATEDMTGFVDLSGIDLFDLDAGAAAIGFTIAASSGVLSATSAGGVTVSGSGTGTLILSGTLAALNGYLNSLASISYSPAPDLNGAAAATMTLSANDGGASGSGGGGPVVLGSVDVDIAALNDAPNLTAPATITVIEDTATALAGVAVSDIDIGAGAVTLTLSVTSGSLSTLGGAGVTVGGTGQALTLTGTLSAINGLLASPGGLGYQPAPDSDSDVTLGIAVTDNGNSGSGGALTAQVDIVLDLLAANDSPTVTGTAATVTFTENDPAAAGPLFVGILADTGETGQDFDQVVLTVTGIADGGDERLVIDARDVTLTNGIQVDLGGGLGAAVAVVGGTATVTLSGTRLDAAALALLIESVAYRHDGDDPTGTIRTVTLAGVRDTGGTANGGSNSVSPGLAATVTIVAVDDPGLARNDTIATGDLAVVRGSVLADNGNGADTDPDDALSVTAVNGLAGNVGTALVLGSGARVTIRADGSFDFDPGGALEHLPRGETIDETVTYTLTGGGTATVTFRITGQDNNDVVDGTAGDDVLVGGIGADIVNGLGGNDVLSGGVGDDRLDGGDGADRLRSGLGADALFGGQDQDTAEYLVSRAGVTVSLLTRSGTGGDAEGDILFDIENLTGSDQDDSLTGDAGDNQLNGGDGNDTLSGSAGADLLRGGAGADSIAGGDGTDTADYRLSAAAVTVNLATGLGAGGEAAGDILSGIEKVVGSDLGDSLTGDGDDTILLGGSGNDTLSGADGNDMLRGGQGADSISGGEGTDTADYRSSAGGVVVNLRTGTGRAGEAEGDRLTGIERVIGSDQRDRLTGDGAANLLGGAGGNDDLAGGDGADLLRGGAGADVIDGGGGVDVADYRASTLGVSVNLESGLGTGGDAQGDRLTGVERLTGSDLGDSLTGDGGANLLRGEAGDDTLAGGAGSDALFGGDGADQFVFVGPDPGTWDVIGDHATGVDRFALSGAAFGLAMGALDPARLALGPQATTADQRLIYDIATGSLSFDADGTGANPAVLLARLVAGTVLVAGDVLVF